MKPVSSTSYLFFEAIHDGQLNVLKHMLQEDASLLDQQYYGAGPLHMAAEFGRLDVLDFLLSQGLSLDSKDHGNHSGLLHIASGCGQLEVAQWLIEKGSPLNDKNDSGSTPLHQACSWGQFPMVKLLVAKGADPFLENDAYQNALHIAKDHRKMDILNFLLAIERMTHEKEALHLATQHALERQETPLEPGLKRKNSL